MFSKIKNINREFFLHSIFFVSAIIMLIPLFRSAYNIHNQENKILYTVKTPYGTFEGLTSYNGYTFIDSDGQEMRFYGSFSLTKETRE